MILLKKIFPVVVILCFSAILNGQIAKRVLFLGNSYTYFNGGLPQMTALIAQSQGDTLIFDANTPGGYSLEAHWSNTQSLNKIKEGNWDLVVLQDQSQRPSFPPEVIDHQVLPYADSLTDFIKENNLEGNAMFFMTWGKKNGDTEYCALYPELCTYEGDQKRLTETYIEMSIIFQATLSPVGIAWKVMRDSVPSLELYAADGSHPSLAGTYLSACIFYASIFEKSCIDAYYPEDISESEAEQIQYYSDQVIFNNLSTWNNDFNEVIAGFEYNNINDYELKFTNTSDNSNIAYWDFGDGGHNITFDTLTHTYEASGSYTVSQIACRGYYCDTLSVEMEVEPNHNFQYSIAPITVFPNPTYGTLFIKAKSIEFVKIYNSQGTLLWSKKPTQRNEIKLDVSFLAKGLYFLQWYNKSETSVLKFYRL